MDGLTVYVGMAVMIGYAHFCIYMAAYTINRRYLGGEYRFRLADMDDMKPLAFLYAYPKDMHFNKKPFLLTIDGEKWTLLHYVADVILCCTCLYLWGMLSSAGAATRVAIVFGVAEISFAIMSLWIHRAADKVIDLSKQNILMDIDQEKYLKRKMRAIKKEFPEKAYVCDIVYEKNKKGFWTYEKWSVMVQTGGGEVITIKPVMRADTYRYYDGPIIRLDAGV